MDTGIFEKLESKSGFQKADFAISLLYKDDFVTSRIKLEPTPSSADFTWVRRDFRIESIKIELPKIAEEYGEFWHRQFPLKQHWRVCEEF